MDLATVMSVIQTVLTAIQTLNQLKSTLSLSNCERELADLHNTINFVKSVLEDVDERLDTLNHQEKFYIEELKDAIYDASDVLDEFVTLLKRKQLAEVSDKLSDKVKSFLSHIKLLSHNLSAKVRHANKKLDDIASKSSKFCFKVENNKPVRFRKGESSSFVSPSDTIIGRHEDLEKIVEMLFDPDDVSSSSLAIVGMGGLGKTAFAQLVYNDPRVTSAFQLKSWICIGDQDQWNLTYILGKIMKGLNVQNNHDLPSLEQIYQEIKEQLGGKKYLLVLDDVWTESYYKWQELVKFLMVGESGSRIVVTTRSKKTAKNIGGVRVHELQGLSDDESWCLFERMAFRPDQRENLDEDLVKLGKEIVKKCINVPLAIRVVGSLLHGESMSMWLLFRDKEMANISDNDDTMKNILSLSYHQLDSSLKSCFAYCAVFPKDFEIDKQMLINLWMAQGYVNLECEGEEKFCILLQRCFFQDVTDDNIDEIKMFKIHDLLHDIAEQASVKEIRRLNSNSDVINVDKKVRHLTLLNGFCPQGTLNKTYIRTCLQVKETTFIKRSWNLSSSDGLLAGNSIANWPCLRSLDLSYLDGHSLPESIGKLFHLRYLDLTRCYNLEVLPKSITKLVNLQTLILYGCESLQELPNDTNNLVDLTTLDLSSCYKLNHMHSTLGMMTNLHTLGLFVVGRESSSEKQCFDGLKLLHSLNNLKGSLQIRIIVDQNSNYDEENYGGGAYLRSKEHLSSIVIKFKHREHGSVEWEPSLLQNLQPHVDIKHLYLGGYNGETMPRWPRREDNSTLFYFPYLVNLEIIDCRELRFLPSMEKLPHLKKLRLWGMPNVEYMVNDNLDASSLGDGSSFFPCLEELSITKLRKLKGWWPGYEEQSEPSPCFAQLKDLTITRCPRLKSIPICSSLKCLFLTDHLRDVQRNNMDKLPYNYKSLLPLDSKSRFITVADFERLTYRMTDFERLT